MQIIPFIYLIHMLMIHVSFVNFFFNDQLIELFICNLSTFLFCREANLYYRRHILDYIYI